MGAKYKVPRSFIKDIHQPLQRFSQTSKDGIDASMVLSQGSNDYVDLVHVNQEGNSKITGFILNSPEFKAVVDSCS